MIMNHKDYYNNSNSNNNFKFTNMNKDFKFTLAHYRDIKCHQWNRKCPHCGQREFSPYINVYTGEPLDDKSCGKCNRETNCGYHEKPKDWFEKHRLERREWLPKEEYIARKRQERKEAEEARRRYEEQEAERKARRFDICRTEQHPDAQAYIDRMGELCEQSQSTDNALARWLYTMFPKDKVDEVLRLYRTGSTPDGWIIFWGIDIHDNVHTGKMMAYGADGHRLKGKNIASFNWVHAKEGIEQLADQCLFGEHRLMGWDGSIAIVESEKTAIYLTLRFPNILWLATGGKQNFKHDVLWPICGREVFVLPDVDALDDWMAKAEVLNREHGYRFIIHKDYVRRCTPEARGKKQDLADMLLMDK